MATDKRKIHEIVVKYSLATVKRHKRKLASGKIVDVSQHKRSFEGALAAPPKKKEEPTTPEEARVHLRKYKALRKRYKKLEEGSAERKRLEAEAKESYQKYVKITKEFQQKKGVGLYGKKKEKPKLKLGTLMKTPLEARQLFKVYKKELEALAELAAALGGAEKAKQNVEYMRRIEANKERAKRYWNMVDEYQKRYKIGKYAGAVDDKIQKEKDYLLKEINEMFKHDNTYWNEYKADDRAKREIYNTMAKYGLLDINVNVRAFLNADVPHTLLRIQNGIQDDVDAGFDKNYEDIKNSFENFTILKNANASLRRDALRLIKEQVENKKPIRGKGNLESKDVWGYSFRDNDYVSRSLNRSWSAYIRNYKEASSLINEIWSINSGADIDNLNRDVRELNEMSSHLYDQMNSLIGTGDEEEYVSEFYLLKKLYEKNKGKLKPIVKKLEAAYRDELAKQPKVAQQPFKVKFTGDNPKLDWNAVMFKKFYDQLPGKWQRDVKTLNGTKEIYHGVKGLTEDKYLIDVLKLTPKETWGGVYIAGIGPGESEDAHQSIYIGKYNGISTYYHEVAHAIHWEVLGQPRTATRLNTELERLMKKAIRNKHYVRKYAVEDKSIAEFFACNFASYFHERGRLKSDFPDEYNLIDNLVKRGYYAK